jgi:hypothetical protein
MIYCCLFMWLSPFFLCDNTRKLWNGTFFVEYVLTNEYQRMYPPVVKEDFIVAVLPYTSLALLHLISSSYRYGARL